MRLWVIKNRPLRDDLNTSWGLVSDRIGETGFEPAASCSQSRDTFLVATGLWGVPAVSARRAARTRQAPLSPFARSEWRVW